MSIRFDASSGLFTLETARTTYAMQVDDRSHLLHLYYGRRIGQGDLSALYPAADHGFSPDYYASRHTRGLSSPDVMPQEYTGCNTGDFRLCCLAVRDEAGALGAEFVYDSHRVEKGKYALEGLPAAHDEEDEAETLVILLKDPVSGLEPQLQQRYYAQLKASLPAAKLPQGAGPKQKTTRAFDQYSAEEREAVYEALAHDPELTECECHITWPGREKEAA